jgi:hypothetical protein
MTMFFSRRCRCGRKCGLMLKNQQLGRNQGVLFKILGEGPQNPNVCSGALYVKNQGVLYKMTDVPFAVALPLLLAIVGRCFGMALAVGLLIVGMILPPLAAAIADDLGVDGIGSALLSPVLVAPFLLATRIATDALIRAARGGLKGGLAIRAAARRHNRFLRGWWCDLLRKSVTNQRRNVESDVEY